MELLVVIAIIGVLIALLLPAVQAAREAARRMQCTNHIKQCSLALHNYHDVNGMFPCTGWMEDTATVPADTQPGAHVRILPFIEQQALYDTIDWKVAIESTSTTSNHGKAGRTKITYFACPSSAEYWSQKDATQRGNCYTLHYYIISGAARKLAAGSGKGPPTTTEAAAPYTLVAESGSAYLGPSAVNGISYPGSLTTFGSMSDGTSNTFAFGEISWDGYMAYRMWTVGTYRNSFANKNFAQMSCKSIHQSFPINNGRKARSQYSSDYESASSTAGSCGPGTCEETRNIRQFGQFGSNHSGGANFGLGDGSVRFVSDTTDVENILMPYACVNDGLSASL